MSNPRRKVLMLTLTHRCNLSCVYCYESAKNRESMSIETAKAAIRKHMFDDGFDEIEISFHGGEPLLEFENLKRVAEWVWDEAWPKPYILYATTNGTLVHGHIGQWFEQHKERVYLGLSLDGTRAMHNANRSCSFDTIDVDFFRRTWPDQAVKMTVSPGTLSKAAKGIIYLHERGFKVEPGFAHGMDWRSAELLRVFDEQLRQLIQYYFNHPHVSPSSFVLPEFAAIGRSTPAGRKLLRHNTVEQPKWCGIGSNLVAVDCDGTEYPCHLFMPFTIGAFHRRSNPTDFTPEKLQDAACGNCPILPVCPTCYASNEIERGRPAARDRALCVMTQHRIAAASYLVGEMLAERQRFPAVANLDPTETALAILGIEAVQSHAGDAAGGCSTATLGG